ncbi:MAG: hypothetical protein CBD32_02980 [Actinobacteria bacterium TMED172]|nr:hypothetical protein [Cellvibrionales bacterium]OUW33429.1 MAG: hypothetical protein CBD32_02980 [Actinobacteria bacterium TMED172]|tara:strand:+ start:15905 stop:16618 length:714 start_codon:yes stop_codon:yes gene_type:complete
MSLLSLILPDQKLLKIILFSFIEIISFPFNHAHANFISLATEEIRDLEQVGPGVSPITNDATSVLTNYTLDGATFLSFWLFNSDGQNSASIQTPIGWTANWENFNSFQQQIINRDESPWSFKATLYDGVAEYESDALLLSGIYGDQIIPGESEGTLFIDLSSAHKEQIQWVRFSVSGNLPVRNYDRVVEYEIKVQFGDINEVPLPSSFFLFLSGLFILNIKKFSISISNGKLRLETC